MGVLPGLSLAHQPLVPRRVRRLPNDHPSPPLCRSLLMFCFESKLCWCIPAGTRVWQASFRARKTNICEQVFSLRATKYCLSSQDPSWLSFDKQAFELKAHRVVQTSAISPWQEEVCPGGCVGSSQGGIRPTFLDTLPSETGRSPRAATPPPPPATPVQGCTLTCCDPSGEKDMKFPLRKYP